MSNTKLPHMLCSALILPLLLLLVCGLTLNVAVRAYAQEDDLEALQLAALQASDLYEDIQNSIAELTKTIETNTARADELKLELIAQRERTAAAIRSSYKLQQAQPDLIDLLLSAEDFNGFITTFRYLESLSEAHARQIDKLVSLDNELTDTLSALQNKSLELKNQEAEAAEALTQAQDTLAAARARAIKHAEEARKAYEAEQARKAAEAQAATQAAKPQAAKESGAAETQSQEAQQAAPEQQAPEQGASASEQTEQNTNQSAPAESADNAQNSYQPSEPDVGDQNAQTQAPASEASYTWVLASEYGEGDGLMYSETATGDIVTPTSMGIAMRYMPLGTMVELSYNGNVCVAVVNDRGPYIAGREIDLQPAVKHALGFEGLGTVGYRVIS